MKRIIMLLTILFAACGAEASYECQLRCNQAGASYECQLRCNQAGANYMACMNYCQTAEQQARPQAYIPPAAGWQSNSPTAAQLYEQALQPRKSVWDDQ